MKLLNAVSLNMIEDLNGTAILTFPIGIDEARKIASQGIESVVGHADTAAIFSSLLEIEVPFNRTTVLLKKGEEVLVGQYKGPRLPEGVKELPQGATVEWILVRIR